MLVFLICVPHTCTVNSSFLPFQILRKGKSPQNHTLYRRTHGVMNYVRKVMFACHIFTPMVCPRHTYGQIRISISRCAMWALGIHRPMSISNFIRRPYSGTSNDGELIRPGTHCMKTPRYRVTAISGHVYVIRTWHIWYGYLSARKQRFESRFSVPEYLHKILKKLQL